ncbi:hypothetical protein F444_06540 [Phytophthora nicotianae P1976]|uniref:Uncharacterized protein n=1 Tax=Phytophthora nicotianae P1976 TaxID=1317066 RepID=A0A081AI62_PHYNI|nr:hypothetical protein F444_06540 [Phytophthora nicotianae P1976]
MLRRLEGGRASRLERRQRRVDDRELLRRIERLELVHSAVPRQRVAQVRPDTKVAGQRRVRLRDDVMEHVVADCVEIATQRQSRGRQRAG